MNGQKLRAYRQKRQISTDGVMREMGVARSRVYAIETSGTVGMKVAQRYLQAVENIAAKLDDRAPNRIEVYADVGIVIDPAGNGTKRSTTQEYLSDLHDLKVAIS